MLNFFIKSYTLNIKKKRLFKKTILYDPLSKKLKTINPTEILDTYRKINILNSLNQFKTSVFLNKIFSKNKVLSIKYFTLKSNIINQIYKFLFLKKIIINNLNKNNFFYVLKQNLFLFTKIHINLLSNIKNLICLKKGINFHFKSLNLTKRLETKDKIEEPLINQLPLKKIRFIEKPKSLKINKQKYLKLKRYCFFKKTKNNNFLTITNGLGEVLLRSSAGLVKVKTKKKKKNKETFMLICQELAAKCFKNKIKMLDKLIIIQSSFKNIFYKLRKIFYRLGLYLKIPNIVNKNKRRKKYRPYLKVHIGFQFVSYHLKNSHNGIRLKKIKRV